MARRAIDPQRHLDLPHEVELVVAGGSPEVLGHDDLVPLLDFREKASSALAECSKRIGLMLS
jgi:hypothetical protein